MDQLWSKNGGPLLPLPERDAEADGTMWTDLANNEYGRQRLGWAIAPCPEVVSRMQLKQALRINGLLDDVQAAVTGSGNEELQIYWADTSEFHRHHPVMESFVTSLGMTAQDADAIWTQAKAIL